MLLATPLTSNKLIHLMKASCAENCHPTYTFCASTSTTTVYILIENTYLALNLIFNRYNFFCKWCISIQKCKMKYYSLNYNLYTFLLKVFIHLDIVSDIYLYTSTMLINLCYYRLFFPLDLSWPVWTRWKLSWTLLDLDASWTYLDGLWWIFVRICICW